MKSTKVVHLGNSKIFTIIRENLMIVIFASIFIFSVLIGCFIYSGGNFSSESKTITDFLIFSKSQNTFFEIFTKSFLFSFMFLFLTYALGTSLLGMAFIPFVITCRGIITALFLCELYSHGVINALVINLLTVIPSTLISVISLICASSTCIKSSFLIGKISIGDSSCNRGIDIKRYLLNFSFLTIITIVSALLEAFMSIAFKKFF